MKVFQTSFLQLVWIPGEKENLPENLPFPPPHTVHLKHLFHSKADR